MIHADEGPLPPLEAYRDYLRMLASPRLGAALRARLDPSDLAQQTLLVGHQKLGDFRGRTEPELRRWLRAILANQLAEAFRRLDRRAGDRAASIERALEDSSTRAEAWVADPGPSPSGAASRRDSLAKLARSLRELPDDQCSAIEQHHLLGLSVPEVARVMGRSTASVAGLLRRGAKTLRILLNDEG